MRTNRIYEVIEDRGCNIRYTRFTGTKAQCADWIKKNCKLSQIGTYVPIENEFEENSNWDYSIMAPDGYFVPVDE